MTEQKFRINDYVLLPTGDIGRITGIDVKENYDRDTITYKVCWYEWCADQPWNEGNYESGEFGFVDLNASILKAMGFKRVAGQSTYRYQDLASRKTVVYDSLDASLTVFKPSKHPILDFMYADYVSDMQHHFSAVGIAFPFLDLYFSELAFKKRNK